MSEYPKGFMADLRRSRSWPSLHGSLWRNPELVRLTYGGLARLVYSAVGARPCRILCVGSGLGHIALELARAGYDVTGVDIDPESVALARRTARADSLQRGSLSYEIADFPRTFEGEGPYDRVLFSRVLHHIDGPAAVARAAALLGPGGRVACVDFAYDRLGATEARWIARWRMWLSGSGWWPEGVAKSQDEEAQRVVHQWRVEHEAEGLNPFGPCSIRYSTPFGFGGSPGIPIYSGTWPPTCASLANKRERSPVALAAMKHSCFDGRTFKVFCSRLRGEYAGRVGTNPTTLAPWSVELSWCR
jgi:SAM-dependent methyltransferase